MGLIKPVMEWRKEPICLLGFVQGKTRLESIGGKDWWPYEDKFFFFFRPRRSWTDDTYAVTHIQYESWFGFLLMWPFCFHIWFQFRKQKEIQTDPMRYKRSRVPGTEFVIYRRAGARWQAQDGTYIWPSLYLNFSTHWD